jgi:flagella basal body P-ring formation protein FlgA
MKARVAQRSLFALAMGMLARESAFANDAGAAIEAHLRAQRPEVQRWVTKPVETNAPAPELPVAAIGRIGPRTAVRFSDGRVRWYSVAGFRPTAVSTHGIERGDALCAADVGLEERDVIGLGCVPVAIDDSQRLRAARRLAAGDAICARSVERTPEVERNRPVTLSAQHGDVSVSRVFTAATDARAGERVRLRDRASGTTVTAIVTGPGAARVSEESR